MDLAVAKEQLRSHNLSDLFTQTLGWQPAEDSAIARCKPVQKLQQRCAPIAYRAGVSVWQVVLSADVPFSSEMRRSLYAAVCEEVDSKATGLEATGLEATDLSETVASPLVIFVAVDKARSLWCSSFDKRAVYVVGQPMMLWTFRLQRLAQTSLGLWPRLGLENLSYEAFEQRLNGLCDGIHNISNRADRQDYAVLTLQRLMLVQSMQAKGWLNGDTWYLQTRFGEALQQGENLFFSDCLQPLYRSLALPRVERSLALNTSVGTVPFLGGVFDAHRLEKMYGAIAIDDQPFEEILGWLSECASVDEFNPWISEGLGCLLEQYWAQRIQPRSEYVGGMMLARRMSDRTLDRLVLSRIDSSLLPPFLRQQEAEATLDDLLFAATPRLCHYLIQDVLPELRLLDPACGSGSLLVALHQRLFEVFGVLTGYIQQNQDTQLKIWHLGLVQETALEEGMVAQAALGDRTLLLNIQKRIFKNNLYGVDISSGAIETSRFQLLMHLIATAEQPEDLEPLVDLSFNIMTGNSLIGLVAVDEERFDQVNKSGAADVLQGDLLQSLAADGYQTALAEKQLALEHYKSRNHMLAQARNIPAYARAALLKEEVLQLDAKAKSKLDALLLSQMSQQLGIQFKTMQLADKPQKRLLSIEDIDILQPFHWGYHFNDIIQRGGFDGIVCAPPWGAFKPTTEEFFQRFQDLAEAKGLDVEQSAKLLKTSKQALAKGDPEITQAWLFYQDQYAYVADYFYRSEQYAHQNPVVNGKSVRNQLLRERLFVEQCFNLLALEGVCAIALPNRLAKDERGRSLFEYLQENALVSENPCKNDERTTMPNTAVVLSLFCSHLAPL